MVSTKTAALLWTVREDVHAAERFVSRMADPFRSEMETVHARNRELEQRVAELDDENRRMVAGFAPTWSRAPFWVLAPALGTIGIFFAALAFLVAFFSMWQVFGPADRTSNPRSCVTVTRP